MNVVSYLRVSSKHQVEGDGFPRQRASIQQWITSTNAVHLAEFTEEGVSGTAEAINRPALTKMVQHILERGDIHAIVVEKADRLARDLIVSELLLRQFEQMGVKVYEAEGGNELTEVSTNPTRKLIRQILSALAEFEKSSIVSRLRAARNRKRSITGRCEGRKPYGADPSELLVVGRIREWSNKHAMTTRQIAKELNAQGIRSRTGKPWSHSVVAAILSR
jgi:DNA invertase Pin-like site-specific DNA recombinase